MLKGSFLSRSLHKWIGLFIGMQVLIWLATGLYMVVVSLDFIHGDTLVRNMQRAIEIPSSSRISMAGLRARYPDASAISLQAVMNRTYLVVTTPAGRLLINPESGDVESPLDQETARDIALFHFNGDAAIKVISLITADPPREIGSRRLPLWRVDFNDRFNTSFYIDPYTGTLVTRRHRYWRIFDFFFMLHIMDYDERTDVHNPLLIVAQLTGVVFVITGIWLLFYSFTKRRKVAVEE